MFKIIENDKEVLAIKFSGKLDGKDYDLLIPLFEEKIKALGKINLYWEMENFQGWSTEALWADLKFDVKHANDFNRIAVVGDQKWERTMADFMQPFTDAEVKFFDLSQRDIALAWAKERAVV